MKTCSFEKIFGDKKRVMFVYAHPDDAEVFSGGLIARLTAEGKQVRIVKTTGGDKGSRDMDISQDELAKTRKAENENSMNILGVKPEDYVFLGYEDGSVENNLEVIKSIAFQIRQFKPDLLVTHNPEDVFIRFDEEESWINHRDHRNTGKSTIDASYPYSRDLFFSPDQLGIEGVSSHSVAQYLIVDHFDHPDIVYFDVTMYLNTKIKALSCHGSQFSREHAQSTAEFFAPEENEKRLEGFRYVCAD